MKAKDLAKELMKRPDFDVDFSFTDGFSEGEIGWPNQRKFNKIEIADIGYSEKLIRLSGTEVD